MAASAKRQTRGCMIEAKEIKRVMSVGELAIGLEKRRIMRDAWFSRSSGLGAVFAFRSIEVRRQQKIFGARVEIKGAQIGCRWSLDGQFSQRGEILACNCSAIVLRDLTLDGEHVRQIAIVCFRPDVGVGASVDQLRIYVTPVPVRTLPSSTWETQAPRRSRACFALAALDIASRWCG